MILLACLSNYLSLDLLCCCCCFRLDIHFLCLSSSFRLADLHSFLSSRIVSFSSLLCLVALHKVAVTPRAGAVAARREAREGADQQDQHHQRLGPSAWKAPKPQPHTLSKPCAQRLCHVCRTALPAHKVRIIFYLGKPDQSHPKSWANIELGCRAHQCVKLCCLLAS